MKLVCKLIDFFLMLVLARVHTSESSVSVELEWTKPTQTFGDVQGYRVKFGPRNAPLEEAILEGAKVHHYKIQKLGKQASKQQPRNRRNSGIYWFQILAYIWSL
jgi:hypothetical protein